MVRSKAAGFAVVTSALMVGTARPQSVASQQTQAAVHRAPKVSAPKIAPRPPDPVIFFQRGVNFTSEPPDIYGSDGARRMLESLPRYGVNAVALVPYGFSSRNRAEVRFPGSMEPDEGVEELTAVAHSLGMKVLLKPGVWVDGGYAGDLEFSSTEDRAKWFAEYRAFLEHYARLAKRIHADIFCVGGEFVKLSKYDAEWRKLITRARELYPGPLVYAANFGSEFESLTFWDALDYIGLQEYYPLPDDLSTAALVQKVEAVQRRFQKPIIFTEAGFSSYEAPNRRPWEEAPRKVSPDDQARCYEAVLSAFYHKPWFQGVYWWKLGSNGYGSLQDGSLTPWGKPAMDVITTWYSKEKR